MPFISASVNDCYGYFVCVCVLHPFKMGSLFNGTFYNSKSPIVALLSEKKKPTTKTDAREKNTDGKRNMLNVEWNEIYRTMN